MTTETTPNMVDRLKKEADLFRAEGAPDMAMLLDEIAEEFDCLRTQVERYEYELARARLMAEGNAKILCRIHAMLYPPVHRTDDGRAIRFESPILHEQFQALSDAIRSIPDEVAQPETTATDIETLRAQVAQYKEDAERFQAIEHDFSVMSPNIDGNHYWVWRGRGYTGPNLRAAIDKARKT